MNAAYSANAPLLPRIPEISEGAENLFRPESGIGLNGAMDLQ